MILPNTPVKAELEETALARQRQKPTLTVKRKVMSEVSLKKDMDAIHHSDIKKKRLKVKWKELLVMM